MIVRAYVCTPSMYIEDKKLNSVSEDAEALFRKLVAGTDYDWRWQYDPDALEHTIRTTFFSVKRRFRAWTHDRITRALNELFCSGLLSRHYHGDRHWLVVAEEYRYRQGKSPYEAPPPPPQQTDLGLSQDFFVLDESTAHRKKSPNKLDKKKKKNNTTRGLGACAAEGPGLEPVTPEPEEEDAHEAAIEKARDAANLGGTYEESEVIKMVGWAEWTTNQGLWLTRLRQDEAAMMRVVRDWKSYGLHEQRKIKNKGAWATAKFYEYSPHSRPDKDKSA